MGPSSLSLSLSLSLWCEALECSWGEKENKKKGGLCVLCGGEKQEKEKKKWNVDENEMKGRKRL